MKTLVITILLTLASSTTIFAADNSTNYYQNYVITVLNPKMWSQCAKETCNVANVLGFGNGQCKPLSGIRIVLATLTPKGVGYLQQITSCKFSIELEGKVWTQPRLGTSN